MILQFSAFCHKPGEVIWNELIKFNLFIFPCRGHDKRGVYGGVLMSVTHAGQILQYHLNSCTGLGTRPGLGTTLSRDDSWKLERQVSSWVGEVKCSRMLLWSMLQLAIIIPITNTDCHKALFKLQENRIENKEETKKWKLNFEKLFMMKSRRWSVITDHPGGECFVIYLYYMFV